jgi:hypothetical protein
MNLAKIFILAKKLVFLGIIAGLGACQVIAWKDLPPSVSQSAPANDGSQEKAVLMLNYQVNKEAEQNPGSLLGMARNYQHQIVIENANGRRPLTGKRPGKDQPGTLYYVKNAGYLLLGSLMTGRDSEVIRYEKIDLATGQASLIRQTQGGSQSLICQDQPKFAFVVERLFPSPDGKWLAHVFSPACGSAKVDFLDAASLSLIDSQTIQLNGVNETHWDAAGMMLYDIQDNHQAWRMSPGQPPALIAYTPPASP